MADAYPYQISFVNASFKINNLRRRSFLYAAERPRLRPAILVFIVASFFLAACGARVANANWPGLSTDGERAYVAYGPGVIAYDVEAQEQVWSFPEEPGASLQFFAAPSVQDGRVIVGDYGESGGFFSPSLVVSVYALDGDGQGTPEILWTDSDVAQDRIVAPPLQVGDRAFVGTADNFVLALDAVTGDLQWEFETEHSVWAQPSYKDGVLFVASLDQTVYALDAESGAELWRRQLGGALAGRPVVDSGLVYVASFDNQVHALDVESGEEQWAAPAEDWVWGAPTLADGVVYFADISGNVFAVEADTGNPVWSQQVAGAVQTSPVVVDDVVYVASGTVDEEEETEQGTLVALAVADGQELWQENTPAPLYSTPIVVGDSIVVAMQSEAALLMAFGLENGGQQWVFAPPSQ